MHHRLFRLLALLAAVALVLSACGDDDADTATDEGTSQDEGGSEGDAGDDDTGEDEAEDAAEDAIGDQSGECGFLGEFATSGFDQALDSEDALTDGGAGFKKLAEEFEEVADAAPGEIKDSFATLAEGMSALASAFEGIDMSDPESFDPSVFEEIDDEKYEQASQEVEGWLEEHCPEIANLGS